MSGRKAPPGSGMSGLPPEQDSQTAPDPSLNHPFSRLDAEVAALRTLGIGSQLSPREIATLLDVTPREVERTWRGIEPLSIRARQRLAHVLHERALALRALERSLRRPVLEVDSGGLAREQDRAKKGRIGGS